jgi:hypothetical protein
MGTSDTGDLSFQLKAEATSPSKVSLFWIPLLTPEYVNVK